MIKVDVDKAVDDLGNYIEAVERKLKNMVTGFAGIVTEAASDATPVGNAEDLEEGLAGVGNASVISYGEFYRQRYRQYGIETEVGFHSGAWRWSKTEQIGADMLIYAPEEAVGRAKQDAEAEYELGDTFYIGARGPGFGDLEEGSSWQAPNGIMQPALSTIEAVYQTELKRLFELG